MNAGRLRVRFVVTAMLSLFILLLMMNATICAVGFTSVSYDAKRMLEYLSSEKMIFGGYFDKLPNHFTVIADEQEHMVLANIVFDPTVTYEQAAAFTETALSGKDTGRIGSYRYTVTHLSVGGYRIVFLDMSYRLSSVYNLIKVSLVVSLVSMLLMLGIVSVVSKKAVAPIAESFEKQRRFVSDAGHEIKTPLAIITANTDALELHLGESKWSGNIRSQTERLAELMKKLLALSKMDEGELSFPFADVDMSALAEKCADAFEEMATEKGCVISRRISGGISLRGNEPSLSELYYILLDNAVKYCTENSVIAVLTEVRGKKCVIEVSNECGNIPEVPPETLFERFYRADSARTQSTGGMGIGLSTAKAITGLHKGRIEAFFEDGTVRLRAELPM